MAARLLRKTGEAIKHSPSALRRALTGGNRGTYQLALVQAQDPFKVGLSFHITYAGCEELSADAASEDIEIGSTSTDPVVLRKVKEASSKPRRRVMLVVNNSWITVADPGGSLQTVRIPIYRVAFAGSHPIHVNAFAFVERLRDSSRFVCHVMLCQSEHMARTVVRVVSKAFQNAFLEWTAKQKNLKRGQAEYGRAGSTSAVGAADSQTAAGKDSATAADDEGEHVYEEIDEPESEGGDNSERVTEEEKDRRALHRSFYRRSIVISNPEKLQTGALNVTPEDFDLEEAAEFVAPLETADSDPPAAPEA